MQTMTRPGVAPGPVAAEPILRGRQPLLLTQGGYYLVAALWAIADLGGFREASGDKADLWLVQTAAVLVAVIAAVLLFAARKPAPPAEVVLLAVASAVALGTLDVAFVATAILPPVHLLDAAAEVLLLVWWAFPTLQDDPADGAPGLAHCKAAAD